MKASDSDDMFSVEIPQAAAQVRTSYPMRIYRYLWEQGWSPFQIVRSALFYGPVLVGKYSSRRFTGLTDEESRDLHDYLVNIISAKGSSEYCICAFAFLYYMRFVAHLEPSQIAHILRYNAYARLPLVDRIAALKMPVTFACKLFCAFTYKLNCLSIENQMVTMTGWTQREVPKQWKIFDKPGINMDGCMSSSMRVIKVMCLTFLPTTPY
jgi:hypothetical protein